MAITMDQMKSEALEYVSKEKINNVVFNDLMLIARNELESDLVISMKDIPIINGTEDCDYFAIFNKNLKQL